jgi:hypothetical protein
MQDDRCNLIGTTIFSFSGSGYCGRLFRMASAEQLRVERRCGQRFPYQVAVTLRVPGEAHSGAGFTQDLSSRGALVWTNFSLVEDQVIEMSLIMPSEITLTEDMAVCCRARVLRLERAEGNKPAVALRIEHYEFPHHELPALQQHTPKHVEITRA